MKYCTKFILLLFFTFLVIDTAAQELVEAKCYGGKQQLRIFINAEMVYPDQALRDKTEGTVLINFIVNEKGEVLDRSIKNSVSPEIDKEALRLFSKILWKPGRLYNNPVRIEQSFPLKFEIKKYDRLVKRRGYSALEYLAVPDSSNKIYDASKVDQLPTPLFEEKDMDFAKFLAENIRYPEAAYKQNIKGTVMLLFVVEPSGNTSNCMITDPVGGGCDGEAQRVLNMIRWKPGIKNGFAVRIMIKLGITFGTGGDSSFEYFPTSHGSSMQ